MATELSKRLNMQLLLEEFLLNPFVKEFYSDPRSYALETELAYAILDYHQMNKALRKNMFERNVVSDFLLEKERIFHMVNIANKEDVKLLEYLWRNFNSRFPTPNLVVYLKAPTDFLVRRVRQRGRGSEARVGYKYLEKLNRAYASFMSEYKRCEVLTLDARRLDTSVSPDPFGEVAQLIRAKLAP